jgi:heme/copper-type cytochrome/quinol oxidase subunit 2
MKQTWSLLTRPTTAWFDALFEGASPQQIASAVTLSVVGLLAMALLLTLVLPTLRDRRRGVPLGGFLNSRVSEGQTAYWLVGLPLVFGLYALDSWAYVDRVVAPNGALVVRALAHRDGWDFVYSNEKVSVDRLVVPKNRPVRLLLSSLEGIRDFRLPGTDVRTPAIKGRYSSLWFERGVTGDFPIGCASDCATTRVQESTMLRVLESGAFDTWLSEPSTPMRNSTMR